MDTKNKYREESSTDLSQLDYLAEWLLDAIGETKDTYNIMYQIAEGVFHEVFPKGSLRVFARNYIVWDDSIYPPRDNPLYDSTILGTTSLVTLSGVDDHIETYLRFDTIKESEPMDVEIKDRVAVSLTNINLDLLK